MRYLEPLWIAGGPGFSPDMKVWLLMGFNP